VERIAVVYNDDADLKPHLNDIERFGESEVIDCASEAAEILGAAMIPVRGDIDGALRQLRKFDVVIDFCEGVLGNALLEKNFALALEMIGVPHTSCDPIAVALCTDKTLVKRLLSAAGLPTPQGFTTPEETPPGTYIVKPSREDAGIGIETGAVVSTAEALEARCRHVRAKYRQPPLIEEFIDGRELNQSMYCGRLLPPGEVVFADHLAASERVVGWKAKWATGSREDLATVNRTPAAIDPATREELARICLAACDLLGLDMTVRFDVRMSQSGVMSIVDINPNPDLGIGSGFRKALDAAGILFSDLLNDLIMAACARRPDEDPARHYERPRPNSRDSDRHRAVQR
jgi:D-alanine-D-alanine ligase